jgi:hypothetical protein
MVPDTGVDATMDGKPTMLSLPNEVLVKIFENVDDVAFVTNVLPFVCRDFDCIATGMMNLNSVTFQCGSVAGGGLSGSELRGVLERNSSATKCLAIRGNDKECTDFFVAKLPRVVFDYVRHCRFRDLTRVVIKGNFEPHVSSNFVDLLKFGYMRKLTHLKFFPNIPLRCTDLRNLDLPALVTIEVKTGTRYWELFRGTEPVDAIFANTGNIRELGVWWDVQSMERSVLIQSRPAIVRFRHPCNSFLDACGLSQNVHKLKIRDSSEIVAGNPNLSRGATCVYLP